MNYLAYVSTLKSHNVKKIVLLFLVTSLMLAAVKSAFAQQTSTNWAGYTITSNDVTGISASWTVPAVQCTVTGATNQWTQGLSVWIGLDGWNNNGIPEQIGTDSDCYNGSPTYSAWEEDPTLSTSLIAFGDTEAGDHVTASIAYLGSNQFQLSIKDITQGESRTYTVIIRGALRSSAEWILEAWYNINTGKQATLPSFQPIIFNDCSASVNNTAGSISQLKGEPLNMVDKNNNTVVTAQGLNQAGTSFSVAEVSPAPEFPNAVLVLATLFTVLVILRKQIAHSAL